MPKPVPQVLVVRTFRMDAAVALGHCHEKEPLPGNVVMVHANDVPFIQWLLCPGLCVFVHGFTHRFFGTIAEASISASHVTTSASVSSVFNAARSASWPDGESNSSACTAIDPSLQSKATLGCIMFMAPPSFCHTAPWRAGRRAMRRGRRTSGERPYRSGIGPAPACAHQPAPQTRSLAFA